MKRLNLSVILSIWLTSCTLPTFYEKSYNLNKSVSEGKLADAELLLKGDDAKLSNTRLRFLYEVNAGTVLSMQGKFKESNAHFEKADLFVEDYQKKFGEQSAAFLLNPNISTYRGEDHEVLMVHYYKALNYLQMADYENALVEARRMDLKLQQLSDKYKSENKYQKDAFIHLLMGIVYDASDEYNNAFIAYRNALEIYQNEFKQMFKLDIPQQLKLDLVRTADLAGLYSERDEYVDLFGLNYVNANPQLGQLVILWNNGLGPIKDEWGINFAVAYGENGWVTFINDEYGMTYPFYIGENGLSGLTWVKVVFPRYVERPELFATAQIVYNENIYPFNLVEDINAISFKVLEERMVWEFSKSLIRVAIKQAIAASFSKENEGLATMLSLIGSFSESADTRNWQTLPHSIYYSRLEVDPGHHEFKMQLVDVNGTLYDHPVDIHIRSGETLIYPINTMATTFRDNHGFY